MKVNLDQLAAYLQPLRPAYLLSGNEPLLIEDSIKKIRLAAEGQGITHRETLSVTASFNWPEFTLQAANLSLFSQSKLIELRFTQKINASNADHLVTYLHKKSPEDILVIITDKLDAAQQKTAWFNLLNKQGIYLPLFPPTPQQLPQWIKQRLQAAGLVADQAVIALLAERTYGNLLASEQEIEKLAITFGKSSQTVTIRLEDILNHGSEQGQYDIFMLVDSCLNRQPSQASKILTYLEQTGAESPIVLWALTRELRVLITVREFIELQGMHMHSALLKAGVWEKRQPLVQNYLQHSKLSHLYTALQKAAHIDQVIKGIQPGDVWQELLTLCLELTNKRS